MTTPTFRARPYANDADRQRMLDLLAHGATAGAARGLDYWHPGDILHGMYQHLTFDPTQRIRLWEDAATGQLLGFAWLDPPNGIDWQMHPTLRGAGALEAEMLAWGRERSANGAGQIILSALDNDPQQIAWLHDHGFTRNLYTMVKLRRSLDDEIHGEPPPAGWTTRAVGGEAEWVRRAELHRATWYPSRVTLAAYRRLRAIPGYTPDLDLVAVNTEGVFGAYTICWLDAVNRIGEFEPVGAHPAYRRRGLASAVLWEGLRRLRAAGMRAALVSTNETNTPAIALYQSVGFSIATRERYYAEGA